MRNTEKALSALFAIAREPVLGVRGGKIVFMNPAAEAALGAQCGQPAGALLPEELLEAREGAFVASARVAGREAILSTSELDGLRLYFIEWQARSPAPSSDVGPSLRSVLASLRLLVERQREGEPGPKDHAVLEHCYYQLLRLLQNASTVAALEREPDAITPERLDLAALCGDLVSTVALFAQSRGVTLTFACQAGTVPATLDRSFMERLLMNLLTNSLLHTGPGGQIRLVLGVRDGKAVLSVDDDGAGIAPELLPSLFTGSAPSLDPTRGAGLGLRLARLVAEAHGGTLLLESRPGEGTAVRVLLPLDRDESGLFRAARVDYRTDGMELVLAQLSPWLRSGDYAPRLLD